MKSKVPPKETERIRRQLELYWEQQAAWEPLLPVARENEHDGIWLDESMDDPLQTPTLSPAR